MRKFAVLVFAVTLSFARFGLSQEDARSPSTAPPASPETKSGKPPKPAPHKASAVANKTASKKAGQKKATSSKKTGSAKPRKPVSPRIRRARAAFVASANLRLMAQQLLQDRTPTAYAGVEAYARRHAKEDAGALAWLVVGYAHTLDHDYAKAIDPLNRAKAGASELSDYVTYYLGDAYMKTGRNAEALATLSDFRKTFPDSLLIRDADLAYANVLLEEGRAQEAAVLLEQNRTPVRSDIEFALGRAYEATGDRQKAADVLRNLYYTLPNSFEADAAGAELRKLGVSGSLAERRTRVDLLFKSKHYNEAANEYRDLVNETAAPERVGLRRRSRRATAATMRGSFSPPSACSRATRRPSGSIFFPKLRVPPATRTLSSRP